MFLNFKPSGNYFERTDVIVNYFREVRSFDVLTEEEEKELFTTFSWLKDERKKATDVDERRKIDNAIQKIRDSIINANLRLVISIARVYSTKSDISDLISEGNIGLVKAVDLFDVTRGVRFQTLAMYYIRQAIRVFQQKNGSIVKKNNITKTFFVSAKANNEFVQKYHREPSNDELKEFINENYKNAQIKDEADIFNVSVISIDEAPEDEDSPSNISNITDYNSRSASNNSFEKESETNDIKKFVSSLLNGLPKRDKKILEMYFGINQEFNVEYEPTQIAEALNLTPERIRQRLVELKQEIQKKYKQYLAAL